METTSGSSLQEGRSRGPGPITLFDAETFPTRIAAERRDFDLADYVDDALLEEYLRNTGASRSPRGPDGDRAHSGPEAEKGLDPARFGVYLGSGEGQQDFPHGSVRVSEQVGAPL